MTSSGAGPAEEQLSRRPVDKADAPPRSAKPVPFDRVFGWVIFFVAIGLFLLAMVVKPSSGDIPGVTAVDIGDSSASNSSTGSASNGDTGTSDTGSSDSSADPSDTGTPADDASATSQPPGSDQTAGSSITLAFTGDVLVHESVAGNALTESGYDFGPQFAEVAPVLESADLALCHLETPISADNTSLSYYPAFLVPSELADGISQAGFDGCSVASNHTLDAGESGARSTFDELDRVGLGIAGIAGPGENRGRSTIYRVKDVTIGHLSYTYGLNGLEPTGRNAELTNIIDAGAIEADAASLKDQGADFVVVSAHWGGEYRTELSDQQATLGPELIESTNIDLVIGHHAHVLQQVTKYDGGYVAYGLGNFLSNQSAETCDPCPASTQDGAILLVDIGPTTAGQFGTTGLRAIPTWVDRTNGHVIRIVAPDGPQADSHSRTTQALTSTGTNITFE